MIEVLTGENDFELTQKVAQLKVDFDGRAERYEAADLTSEQLADIFAGQTLFAIKRLVMLDQPSLNSQLWHNLPTWAGRLSDDTRLVLVEPKLDKRTSTYKWLVKKANVQHFNPLDERDIRGLREWTTRYAKQNNLSLTAEQTRRLTDRAGPDQWTLAHAIEKLVLLSEVTDQWIDDVVDATSHESVFALFETSLNGERERISQMLERLRQTEEPFRIFGLINSQLLQLTTLIYGQGNVEAVARDMNAKTSYPLQKLAPFATRISTTQAKALIKLFAEADIRLKSSDADPWLVLESTLLGSATVVNS